MPGAFLIALLQRTPVVRVAASAADVAFASSPVSAVLKGRRRHARCARRRAQLGRCDNIERFDPQPGRAPGWHCRHHCL